MTSSFILIREYKPTDTSLLGELLRNTYSSNVYNSWCNAAMKEITLQMFVLTAAILFIFVGIPFHYCIISVPVVLVVIYVFIYSSNMMKALELTHSLRPMRCWVAEAHEPLLTFNKPKLEDYEIILDDENDLEDYNTSNCRKSIIATISVSNHKFQDNSVWLHRLAFLPWCHHCKLASEMFKSVRNWCQRRGYKSIELALSECQDDTRDMVSELGFEVKQLYHKQFLGSIITLQMFHLVYNLEHSKFEV